MEAEGSGITLARKDGKTAIENGGLRAVAELAGDSLLIRDSSVNMGTAVAVHARGNLVHPFSPAREGRIFLSSAAVPVDSLFTAFINNLPKSLQEASVTGTMGADGILQIAGNNAAVRRRPQADRCRHGNPDPEIQRHRHNRDHSGIHRSCRARKAPEEAGIQQGQLSLAGCCSQKGSSWENRAVQSAESGSATWRWEKPRWHSQAGNGITELVSLQSTLLGGTLLGDGFFSYGKKMEYGVDLTVGNLSLRSLCSTYPSIKGYISGKVDGIVSLFGQGSGLNGLRGFMNIWAHPGPDEDMLVSKEFLQKLAGKKLKGLFFRNDRPYDTGEIRGYLQEGYLTFDTLDISHTNFLGVRDLSVTVAPVQNRIELGHLLTSIKEAATRGKAVGGAGQDSSPPVETDFQWQE